MVHMFVFSVNNINNHQNHRDVNPTECTSTPNSEVFRKVNRCLPHLIVLFVVSLSHVVPYSIRYVIAFCNAMLPALSLNQQWRRATILIQNIETYLGE